jgi:CBS domain-containing protein
MAKTVQDVMSRPPLTIDAHSPIDEVARQMRRWDVREVLVTDHGRFCGKLADSDIIVLAIASGRHPSTITAEQACDPETPRLATTQPIDDAIDHMRERGRQRLPVLDRNGHLVGVAWIDDLLTAIPRQMAVSQP